MSNRSFLLVAVVIAILLTLVVIIHRPRRSRGVHGQIPTHGDLR